jgi:hypothetical protein
MTNKPFVTRAVIAALIIVAIGVAAAVPTWMPRALVEYNMTGYAYAPGQFDFNMYGPVYTTQMPDTYTYVNSNTPLIVALHWENRGNVDESLQLTLTTENANITWFSTFRSDNITEPVWITESDGQTYTGTAATFLEKAEAHSALLYKYVDVLPVGNPQNFTITFSLSDISNGFGSMSPRGTTTATYELTSANIYQLVK